MSIPAFRTKGEWIDRSRPGVLKDQQEPAVGKTILDIGVALPCLRVWIQSRMLYPNNQQRFSTSSLTKKQN